MDLGQEATASQGQAGLAATGSGAGNQEYLTFLLDNQEYGVDILRVQEIRQWTPTTRLPNCPPQVRGVINIRGTIVPIVDPRECFGMDTVDYGPMTVVIVLRVVAADRERVVGLVVDAVSDVYDVHTDKIKEAVDLGDEPTSRYTSGIITFEDKLIILLDVDQLLQTSHQF